MDKNYDIIFTGLAQNCEIHIDKFFKIYNEIKKNYKTIALISENNSKDYTFDKIIKKSTKDDSIIFIDSTFIENFNDRVHRLANARQQQKDYIVSKKITAKFLVVIDLDDVLDFKFDLKKFQNLLNFLQDNKNKYFALSVKSVPYYYDILNFESKNFPNTDVKKIQLDKKINSYKMRKKKIYDIQKKITELDNFECISAFNGMCIYNFQDYLLGEYFNDASSKQEDTIPEHLNLNRKINFLTKKNIYVSTKLNFKMPDEHKPLLNIFSFFINKFLKYILFYFYKI